MRKITLVLAAVAGCSSLKAPARVSPAPPSARALAVFVSDVELRSSLPGANELREFGDKIRASLVTELTAAGLRPTTSSAEPRQLVLRGEGPCGFSYGDNCQLTLSLKSDRGEPIDDVRAGFRLGDEPDEIAKYLVDQLDHSSKLASFTPAAPAPQYGGYPPAGPPQYPPAPANGYGAPPPAAPPTAPAGSCGKDTDCPGNQICAQGFCREPGR